MNVVRTKGYIKAHNRPECDSCIFMKWIGSGSKSQQDTVCTKIEPNFIVMLEDCCDEFTSGYNNISTLPTECIKGWETEYYCTNQGKCKKCLNK